MVYNALPTNMETLSNYHMATAEPLFVISKISQYLSKMLAVIKHAVAAIFFFQQHRASAHNAWFVQHSSAAAVQSLISSTAMAQQPRDELR